MPKPSGPLFAGRTANSVSCKSGICVASCVYPYRACPDASCQDLYNDPNSCGACNMPCPAASAGKYKCLGSSCMIDCTGTGLISCGNKCIDTSSDTSNCGSCATPCLPIVGASVTCAAGKCIQNCPSGQTSCGAYCANINGSDNANCGGCGSLCGVPIAQTGGEGTFLTNCQSGKCAAQCPSGSRRLSNRQCQCNDPLQVVTQDGCKACPNNCSGNGKCGLPVPPLYGNAPQCTCDAGCTGTDCSQQIQTTCSGVVTSTYFDIHNCGKCGNQCSPPITGSTQCSLGTCQIVCPIDSGLTPCNGQCRDFNADAGNCGSCGNNCKPPTGGSVVCTKGLCQASCPAGLTNCNGVCLNLTSNMANCVTCGSQCTSPFNGGSATCNASQCQRTCPSGLTLCGDTCKNIAGIDNANCGGCGFTCQPITFIYSDGTYTVQSCRGGSCTFVCPQGAHTLGAFSCVCDNPSQTVYAGGCK